LTPTFISSTASSAERPRCGGVAGAAGEREIDQQDRQRHRLVHAGERRRMPGDRGIHVGEGAIAHHEGFRGAAFLRRAAVVAHAALDALRGQPVLHRRGGQHRPRAEQVVPAGVARAVARQRPMLRHPGLLAQLRQRVELAEDGDHRPVLAGLAHDGGGDAGDAGRDAEAFGLQHGDMLGGGAHLLEVQLRHAPDAVAQTDIGLLPGFDLAPDVHAVQHRLAPRRKRPA
jgi:hypothetical protein